MKPPSEAKFSGSFRKSEPDPRAAERTKAVRVAQAAFIPSERVLTLRVRAAESAATMPSGVPRVLHLSLRGGVGADAADDADERRASITKLLDSAFSEAVQNAAAAAS